MDRPRKGSKLCVCASAGGTSGNVRVGVLLCMCESAAIVSFVYLSVPIDSLRKPAFN